jgi:hypothetical protein
VTLKIPQTEQQLARAEARLQSLQEQKKDAPIARREYCDAQYAEREKTERLRALRLANEARTKERTGQR